MRRYLGSGRTRPAVARGILDQVNAISPIEKTALTDAVEAAVKALSCTEQPATVASNSDGLESCERDPCGLAQSLQQGSVGFTAHVVGFGLGADEYASWLACVAENTGGQYIIANSQELGAALKAVETEVTQADPEPEPALQDVLVEAAATSVGGPDQIPAQPKQRDAGTGNA